MGCSKGKENMYGGNDVSLCGVSGDLPIDVFGPQHRLPDRNLRGMGWLPDVPDFRDTTIDALTPKYAGNKAKLTVHEKAFGAVRSGNAPTLPSSVDNSACCSPVEDQKNLSSCTANAGAGMIEYMQRRAYGRHIDMSRLFLYKVSRKLLRWTGDTGAFLRTTMEAMVLFGVPPEEWWPYDATTFDNEPDPFMYAYASNYQAQQYVRLDPVGCTKPDALKNIKTVLSMKYVAMFGFTVYSSLDNEPDIPFPSPKDRMDGGHAIVAVGYDDAHPNRGTTNKGALKIRNSWGTGWGADGYGWLPYDYVLKGLASDFWTVYREEWVDTDQFK